MHDGLAMLSVLSVLYQMVPAIAAMAMSTTSPMAAALPLRECFMGSPPKNGMSAGAIAMVLYETSLRKIAKKLWRKCAMMLTGAPTIPFVSCERKP